MGQLKKRGGPLLLAALFAIGACAASFADDGAVQTKQNTEPAYESLLTGKENVDHDTSDAPRLRQQPKAAAEVDLTAEDEAETAPKKPANEVFLDADNISYGENSGLATAEGNVKVRNKELRLFAPYAEYNANTNIVDAYSDHREDVVIYSGGDKYVGKHLKYNMATGRGVLTQVTGKSEAMYMNGGTVKLMPLSEAEQKGIVRFRKKNKKLKDDDSVAQWDNVTSTTCDFTNPHYRLVSKRVVIFPGKKTVVKKPKFYIGKVLVMPYPFDYIIYNKRAKEGLMPIFRYDSNKGMGFGIKGPIDIGDYGEVNVAGVWWTNDLWEAKLRYDYQLFENFTLFAQTNRLYNQDEADAGAKMMWRPSWGMNYAYKGWEAKLWWSERELIQTEMTPGQEERYNVWRKPEFLFYSPWWTDNVLGGKYRVFGIFGRYSENRGPNKDQWIDRNGVGAEYSGSPSWKILNFFSPYYGARYTYYDYPGKDRFQDVTDAWVGVNYKIGAFSFNSNYFWRWAPPTYDSSPMQWDLYSNNRNFYQTISFPLPIGPSWDQWTFSATGAYDDLASELSWMRYTLTYNHHCMTWQIWYKNDLVGDEEKKMGLTFYINAYPEYKLELGTESTLNKDDDF